MTAVEDAAGFAGALSADHSLWMLVVPTECPGEPKTGNAANTIAADAGGC